MAPQMRCDWTGTFCGNEPDAKLATPAVHHHLARGLWDTGKTGPFALATAVYHGMTIPLPIEETYLVTLS